MPRPVASQARLRVITIMSSAEKGALLQEDDPATSGPLHLDALRAVFSVLPTRDLCRAAACCSAWRASTLKGDRCMSSSLFSSRCILNRDSLPTDPPPPPLHSTHQAPRRGPPGRVGGHQPPRAPAGRARPPRPRRRRPPRARRVARPGALPRRRASSPRSTRLDIAARPIRPPSLQEFARGVSDDDILAVADRGAPTNLRSANLNGAQRAPLQHPARPSLSQPV